MSEWTESQGGPAYDEGAVAQYRGKLLLAMPSLAEGPFHRSVVLVLDHDEDGALGVILNRPLEADVEDLLPDWMDVVSAPSAVFEGGPVATDSALAVGLLRVPVEESPIGWRSMFGRVGLVDLDVPVEAVQTAVAGLRVFAGYAGWSAGQLESEVEEGAWVVVDSAERDLLDSIPWRMWHEILRRQGGDLAMLSTFPEDPSHN